MPRGLQRRSTSHLHRRHARLRLLLPIGDVLQVPTEDTRVNIENWNPGRHDHSGFDCGVDRLNNFLKLSAKKQQKDDMSRVYVAVEPGETTILGYHAINVGTMNVAELARRPRGTPSHGEIPVLFLGQVAVDQAVQGLGVGSLLMHHVFEKACVIADEAGCHAVLLDVMSDGDPEALVRRKGWYEEFGFQSFASNEARMFMTIKQVRQIV
ncbi:MAG: GNAT family N-acetyltransferase [Boseongicola sp. SB0676_bin_33]|uniref:GNAT family N-acetyltransferase n=1 Tax=Boseongicola sp. SB0664_bin_43 TaxID=2604844 RepID=A0A6B0Y065_9RHOB|nr:GNAT family N-acetyltransferase [Boseongicola sp. SB0664_bin_43]MYF88666.1 GNAT family N-acetyltransferase [Boseongicola sp. SB0676_bin_33]